MQLRDHVNTFGLFLLNRYGYRVHKISVHAGFTCPNRDGTKGFGGCTFCNNKSFSPDFLKQTPLAEQIQRGREVIRKRTGALKYIAYFQAYTNTYGDFTHLKQLYDAALEEPDVIGLSIGTRPDCVPNQVLDLLAQYQNEGHEVWLELGLQSAFDKTLERINRGHTFAEYEDAINRAHQRNLQVCTHLIVGLPGENIDHCLATLDKVLALGVLGLKIHPLHVVKNTMLAHDWKMGNVDTLTLEHYLEISVEMIRRTPPEICFHRLTATANDTVLLAPSWCNQKWVVLNALAQKLSVYTTPEQKAQGSLWPESRGGEYGITLSSGQFARA